MLTRIVVGVVLAPIFFVFLFVLEPVFLAVLMAAICAIASFELLRATKVAHHNGMYVYTALVAAAIPIGYWMKQGFVVTQVSALFLMVSLFVTGIRHYNHDQEIRFESLLICLFGGLMIPLFCLSRKKQRDIVFQRLWNKTLFPLRKPIKFYFLCLRV